MRKTLSEANGLLDGLKQQRKELSLPATTYQDIAQPEPVFEMSGNTNSDMEALARRVMVIDFVCIVISFSKSN